MILFNSGQHFAWWWLWVEQTDRQTVRLTDSTCAVLVNKVIIILIASNNVGGLVVRGMLETMPDHNVVNYISLSAPLMGQYGGMSTIKLTQIQTWLF